MRSPERLGPHLLVAELARDGVGSLHRAVRLEEGAFAGHRLVRVFAEPWLAAGLAKRLEGLRRELPRLEALRVMPPDLGLELAGAPHLHWTLAPGRSLAQVLARAREAQQPLDLDLALVVLRGVGLALARLHAAGFSHGLLTLEGVWVGFDGSVHLLDAPCAPFLRAMGLEGRPLPPSATTPWTVDLAGLGALLRDLLPADPPADLAQLLGRLEGGGAPLATPEDLERALEAVLFAHDRHPVAFELAFFMHTLFRAELERETLAQRAEAQGHLPLGPPATAPRPTPPTPRALERPWMLVGIGGSALLLALAVWAWRRPRLDPTTQRRLAELPNLMAQLEQQRRDLEARSQAEAQKAAQLQKQLEASRAPEARLRLQQQLAEAQRRKQEADQAQVQAEQRLAQEREAERPVVPPKAVAPTPAPVLATPSVQPPAPRAPAPVAEPVHEQARMIEQVTPTFPARAQQQRWELDREHQVRLRVYVSEGGAPIRVSVVEGVPGGYGFDEAAVAAANESRFTPALRDGRPARGWTGDIVYRFQRRR